MFKILGSWSGMRKYLEKEMLAPSLQGRVRYGCTHYVGMDNCRIFEVFLDGRKAKRFSWETVNSYFIQQGLTGRPFGTREYWQDFWPLLERTPMPERSEYTDEEFCDALTLYRSQLISDSLLSENPLVRMFAILDHRVGKRTLEKLKETVDRQPPWLQPFYRLRLEAEQARLCTAAAEPEDGKQEGEIPCIPE